jgi:pyruvate,water dikinase
MISPLVDATDASVFGGKAAQLGAAICWGLPVPDGIAISCEAVQAIAHEDATMTAHLADAVAGLGLSAVRSSALDEDSFDASFAGAHLSVLAVSGPEAITSAVRAVHASGQDAGAVSYRAEMGLALTARMAVVVQSLVDADVAGVLFTRNPVTGADERVIEASWGLGEAVVSGLVTPDSYRVARGGQLLERTLGDKDIAIRPEGEVPVDPRLVDEFCLDEDCLAVLDVLAAKCDELYCSTNHDIEFAFRDGEVFLLQRRPITRA